MFKRYFSKNKKQLFKDHVKQVSFEITSKCNRKCAYCPLSFIDRKYCRMSPEIITKTLSSLRTIDYEGSFCLNVYNEPLFDFNYLIEVLDIIRKAFPSNTIRFSTNGDMLTKDKINNVFAFGHIELIVTCHISQNEQWDTYSFLQRVISQTKIFEQVNFSIAVLPNCIRTNFEIGTNSVLIFARNFFENGVDRAGALENIVASHGERTKPCLRPLVDFSISYDGSVYPCCQFCHGVDGLASYIIGNALDQDIFSIYTSDRMTSFRDMATKGPFTFPCKTCSE